MSGPPAAIFDPSQPCSPLAVPPGRTALLLMDIANLTAGIVGDRGPPALVNQGKLRDWALENGIAVYHCSPDASEMNVWPSYAKYAPAWEKIISSIREKPSLEDHPPEVAIKDQSREKVMKRRPGKLSIMNSPGLLEDLKAKEVRSLILAGFTTGGCVLSTVRGANDHDFMVTVAEDACADYTPEVHDVLCKNTFRGTAHVATVSEIVEAWKKVEK